jgi:hypothetical protein
MSRVVTYHRIDACAVTITTAPLVAVLPTDIQCKLPIGCNCICQLTAPHNVNSILILIYHQANLQAHNHTELHKHEYQSWYKDFEHRASTQRPCQVHSRSTCVQRCTQLADNSPRSTCNSGTYKISALISGHVATAGWGIVGRQHNQLLLLLCCMLFRVIFQWLQS